MQVLSQNQCAVEQNEAHRKCVRDSLLITKLIISAPETKKWSNYTGLSRVALNTDSSEYRKLTSGCYCIKDTFVKKNYNKTIKKMYRVLSIERIQNAELMAAFLMKRCEMQQLLPEIKIQTKVMFHATSRQVCEKIIREGFDWRLAGTKKGEIHGHGISLSGSCGFVTQFTQPDADDLCYMLMCYMLEGKTGVGYPGMILPPGDCDTTKSMKTKNQVYVKYHDYTVYPAYMVTYRRVNGTDVDIISKLMNEINLS